jgi:hypothetical protein
VLLIIVFMLSRQRIGALSLLAYFTERPATRETVSSTAHEEVKLTMSRTASLPLLLHSISALCVHHTLITCLNLHMKIKSSADE